VVDYSLLFSNVSLKKCATPLYLKSIQSGHEVKSQITKRKNVKCSGNPHTQKCKCSHIPGSPLCQEA